MINRFKQLKKDQSTNNHDWFEDIDCPEALNFKNYFKESYNEVIQNKKETMRVRRVAVTLNNVLLFLES